MKTFLISFDPFANNVNYLQLYSFIKDNRNFFSHYLVYAGAYIVKSGATIATIRESLKGYFGESLFIVAELDQTTVDGNLPQNMWPWIVAGTTPQIALSNQ